MNNNFRIPLVFLAGLILSLSACDRAPVQKLVNPTVYVNTNPWTSPVWVLYDDEKRTDGALAMLTTMEGQSLDIASLDNPRGGRQCVKYSWDGSEVTQYSPLQREYRFTGFSFIVADDTSKWSTVSRDLTPGGFTQLTLWARGSLNSNVSLKITAFSRVWTDTVNDTWQKITLPLTGATFTNTKEYVTVTLDYTPLPTAGRGNGGVVFIDDIQLEK